MDNKKMPDSFYDWLAECPVRWYRDNRISDDRGAGYFFEIPDEEDNDE